MLIHPSFSCTECGTSIDIGDPFLASATYPARSPLQADSVSIDFLQQNGEVLCGTCATERLGTDSLQKLQGAVFQVPAKTKGQAKERK